MPDPMRTKVCLCDSMSGSPVLSLFLVPEPRVRGASVLHLLEQTPLSAETALSARSIPRTDPRLVQWLQAHGSPAIRTSFHAFGAGQHDPRRVHAVLHDHFIVDPGPIGLDMDDPDEMTRLALLPEHWLGPRRIDDFHDRAVRDAMLAVYRHFGVDRRIPLMYHGYAEPEDGWFEVPAAQA
ncbi:hypothetical protein [Nocardia seriolae]|uniref:Uncharacterized protein n=1 Tax=Nocardia seriolae TaxID=37332 RepID=A0A0B8N657_9NOCA|nr:hypothetical protein [Nocardia seriolae]APA95941.1 hypothetical protein NS506_01873 [Nocardia seriolae]MTJ65960.1 hypothetical protein [Nocardia seriolae]MTJ73168.1 hypothetical protein [Nocardia seriolae]MTJ86114.1 hypothetical protein [Nocardia seriolae]MTK30110.1 hypothetical protein [Nocardia seriolae]